MPDVAKIIQIETDMTFLFKNITIPLQHQKKLNFLSIILWFTKLNFSPCVHKQDLCASTFNFVQVCSNLLF